MHAALRSLTLHPDPASLGGDPVDIALTVQAIVGRAGGPGEGSFDLTVCTPEWLGRAAGDEFYPGRHHLIVNMDAVSVVGLQRWLEARVRSVSGEDWPEVAGRLARWAAWEFENYWS